MSNQSNRVEEKKQFEDDFKEQRKELALRMIETLDKELSNRKGGARVVVVKRSGLGLRGY